MMKRLVSSVPMLWPGLIFTFIAAVLSSALAEIAPFSAMGALVTAILLGVFWRFTAGVPERALSGITFSSRHLLRLGIIFLGARLHLGDIYEAGFNAFFIAASGLLITLLFIYFAAKALRIDKTLSLLTACGTAICGASAIAAIAPIVKAEQKTTTASIAIIAVVGTIFSISYTFLFPFLGMNAYEYGVLSGGTLHEVAHAIAASEAGGTVSEDHALIIKLTRVALLIPVALAVATLQSRKENRGSHAIPVPWFIFGFLAVSLANTFNLLSDSAAAFMVSASYVFLGMAMAGFGMQMPAASFKTISLKMFIVTICGSLLLSFLGYVLIEAML
ncbi:YeiH family protein [Marinococcus halotolerans]|uniref:YeiH family protein n=1 Tax=Marinococcus halotolerans TaxID=301092 RepID=UPI0003B302C4|nr:putative sulfate exporter family transporter [Marinococcus halotolerans]